MGLFFVEPSPDINTPLKHSDNQTIIYITSEGFAEKEITIPVGGTVTWINTDVKEHWPASDFHPTHTIYPESGIENCGKKKESTIFDACKGLMKGEKYSFTFTQVGSWGYHDHLFPSLTGLIRVVSPKDNQTKIEEEVSLPIPLPERFRALEGNTQAKILNTMSKDNPKKGWEYLKRSFVLNGEMLGEGHTLAHIVGKNAYTKNGFAGIEICDPTFGYGCYHGVTEQFLINEGPEKIREAMDTCRRLFPSESQKNQLPYYSCIHGIGHGLMTWNGLVLKKALFDCDRLDQQEQSYCYDGAFMEFSSSALPQNYFDKENLWGMCIDLDKKYAMGCARHLPLMLNRTFLMTKDDTIAFCKTAPTKILRDGCTDRLAFIIVHTIKDIMEIESACKKIDTEEYQSRCITTAAGELVFQRYQEAEEKAGYLCDSLSKKWQEKCREYVQNIIQSN